MNHFSTRVNGPVDANFFAIEFGYFILTIDIVCCSTGSVLQDIFVARLHDGAGDVLDSRRRLRLSIWRLLCRRSLIRRGLARRLTGADWLGIA